MAVRRECKDARTVKAMEDHGDGVMNMRPMSFVNMFYEHAL
jgi:hypothetical protein